MGKIKRGNYLFVKRIANHDNHVHVYKDTRLLVKWNIEDNKILEGKLTGRIKKLISTLKKEERV